MAGRIQDETKLQVYKGENYMGGGGGDNPVYSTMYKIMYLYVFM